MTDPRQEQREAVARIQRAPLTTQQALERIKQRLSPCDDDLPLAQAVRQRDEMQKAVESFRKRHGKSVEGGPGVRASSNDRGRAPARAGDAGSPAPGTQGRPTPSTTAEGDA